MDIVTHGLMGIVLAAPIAGVYPDASFAFMIGSALPDTDAAVRLLGKNAFLKWHQTYTHSLPIIILFSLAIHLGLYGLSLGGGALGLALGMTFHSLLDYSNTYGIKLWSPFSARRYCAEWVFFIDFPVIAATLWALADIWRTMAHGRIPGIRTTVIYASFLLIYWGGRILLRRRAARIAPAGTLSLLPTALVPWIYLGTAREGTEVRLFTLDALNGAVTQESKVRILDGPHLRVLEGLPEFQTMRGLSPLYHVIDVRTEGEDTVLTCRDLRTRNFDTRFGELRVRLGPDGEVADSIWLV